ncbi:YMGG-like glycine zipper-containing protein [Alphaproteobacteria bacterium]|nr:YMGG-like glycine zipper-containing protein [Alphaproteobacteria bacterium]
MLSKYPYGVVMILLTMAGCASESASIDISSYAPVIDVKGQGYDVPTYYQDLDECRMLGMRVQATYEAQRKKEIEDAQKSALIGALAGAVIGQVVGDTNEYHTGRSATAGAIYGGAVGGAMGADRIDYSHTIAKFGPTGVVDRCMNDRGYRILSAEGFGGG